MKRSLWILAVVALLGWLGYVVFHEADNGGPQGGPETDKPGTTRSGPRRNGRAQDATGASQRHGSPVKGVVYGPDEKPLVGARVRLHRMVADWPRPQLQALETLTTGPGGDFTFRTSRDPDLMVEVTANNCGRLLVEASEQSPRLALRLAHGFRIRGRVLYPDNRPVAGCQVFLEPSVWSQMRAVEVEADRSGRFVFDGVPAEVMRVTARHPDFRPISLSSVTGGIGDEVTLQFDEESLVIKGRVSKVGNADSPVVDAEVCVYPAVLNGGLFVPQMAHTNNKGDYQVTGIGPGNYSVEVRHKDHSTVVRRISVQESREVSFDLMGRATVRGRLIPGTEVASTDLAGTDLHLVGMYGSIARTTVGPDGNFEFRGSSFTLGPATLELAQGCFCFKQSNTRRLQLRVEEEGEVALELELAKASMLRGVVRDEKQRPVSGVQVSTLALRQGAAAVRTTKVLAVTDKRGRYQIRGLPPSSIELRYQHDKYAFHERSVQPEPGAEVQIEAITLTRPATIRGRVTRGDKAVAGAAVFVGRGFKRISQHITGSDGCYVLRGLPAGNHSVKVRFSTLPLATRDDVQVAAGGAVWGIDLVLDPGRRVTGEVVDQEDEPLVDVQIIGPQGVRTRTDNGGKFALEVPLGRVRLRFRSLQDAELGVRIVGPREEHITARVMRAPRAALKARVVGLPESKPLDGAIVELVSKSGDSPLISLLAPAAQARTFLLRHRTEGVRWLELPGGRLYADNIPAGRYLFILHCRGYEPYQHEGFLELPARVEKDLGEIKLKPGAKMRGRVVDPDGKPIADARVLLGAETFLYLPRARNDYRTDADGFFEVGGVGPDSPELVVAAAGYAPATIAIRVPQDLLARTPRTIQLARGGTIEARVVDGFGDPQAYRLVVVAKDRTEILRGRTDERGVVRFRNLPAGVYAVQLHADLRSIKAVVVRNTSRTQVHEVKLKSGRRQRRGR
ncbi:MAG: carboxypeptidase regulatory-like domain-containing protein [Planctomycetota bacterium]|jgi:protocatechuate 3,4-dioxygenase beta subunit